jgi:hypothetical protein
MWQRAGSATNGACYNVSYIDTTWRASDEDAWTTAFPDGDSVGSAPATCAGQAPPEWPWTEPFGLEPTERCPQGERFYSEWPYDAGGGETADTICFSGCQGEPHGGLCLTTLGKCGGDIELTGEVCDGTEDYVAGTTDGAPGGAVGTTEMTDLLKKIYDRQQQVSNREALGTAAVVAGLGEIAQAVEGIEGGGSSGGECDDSACEGVVPGDGDVGVGTFGEIGDDFMERVGDADITNAMSGWELPEGSCSGFEIDPLAALDDQVYTIDAHCGVWDEISPVITTVAIAVWSIMGGFIILRA